MTKSTQVALFLQGLCTEHSSMSVSQLNPKGTEYKTALSKNVTVGQRVISNYYKELIKEFVSTVYTLLVLFLLVLLQFQRNSIIFI